MKLTIRCRKSIHFYAPIMKEKFDDYPARQEDLKAFQEIAATYQSLEQFLVDFVALEPPERSMVSFGGKKRG